jgi:delta-aminolevulinic acid dehydratase/porphobilinogen synthase
MVKPAGMYLDIIKTLKDSTTLPISAYQAGGFLRITTRAIEPNRSMTQGSCSYSPIVVTHQITNMLVETQDCL